MPDSTARTVEILLEIKSRREELSALKGELESLKQSAQSAGQVHRKRRRKMPENPGGESLQALLQILTDTVLDEVPDRITALSQVLSPAARQAPCQFRAIRNDLHDENARFAFSSIQPGSRGNIQFSRQSGNVTMRRAERP
jgi:hypothetical protein